MQWTYQRLKENFSNRAHPVWGRVFHRNWCWVKLSEDQSRWYIYQKPWKASNEDLVEDRSFIQVLKDDTVRVGFKPGNIGMNFVAARFCVQLRNPRGKVAGVLVEDTITGKIIAAKDWAYRDPKTGEWKAETPARRRVLHKDRNDKLNKELRRARFLFISRAKLNAFAEWEAPNAGRSVPHAKELLAHLRQLDEKDINSFRWLFDNSHSYYRPEAQTTEQLISRFERLLRSQKLGMQLETGAVVYE